MSFRMMSLDLQLHIVGQNVLYLYHLNKLESGGCTGGACPEQSRSIAARTSHLPLLITKRQEITYEGALLCAF
jgi:hypothetical protein